MCSERDAPAEETHKPYVVDGGKLCTPTGGEGESARRQNASYPMSVVALVEKYKEKMKGFTKIKCPDGVYSEYCFRDGLTVVGLEFYNGDASDDKTSGSDAVVGITVRKQDQEAVAARCRAAHKAMLGKQGDFASRLSALLARCGEACDVKHTASCGHLAKGMASVCKTSKSVCKKLCETLTSKSAKAEACKLAK